MEGAGLLSRQYGEPMQESCDIALKDRHLGTHRFELSLSLSHVAFSGLTRLGKRAGKSHGVLVGRDILLGNGQTGLKAAQVRVVPADIPQERHKYIAAILFGSSQICLGCLDLPSNAAEEV